jgi:hypothetical protein
MKQAKRRPLCSNANSDKFVFVSLQCNRAPPVLPDMKHALDAAEYEETLWLKMLAFSMSWNRNFFFLLGDFEKGIVRHRPGWQ